MSRSDSTMNLSLWLSLDLHGGLNVASSLNVAPSLNVQCNLSSCSFPDRRGSI